MDPYICM